MAQGVLGLLLSRNKNKIVQQFTIGFDFDTNAVDIAKLKIGTYVVAQVKKNELPWNEWIYQRSTGLVVNKQDNSIRLPYNHVTFNILNHQ
jgi:ribosomal protein L11 methylase PrmA